MATKMSPQKIEENLRVSGKNTHYFIGCISEGKITIHSQQIRALNLAYALSETKKVSEGTRVAIIGAGFSGIMLAAALTRTGCFMDLFDEHEGILDMQRRSDRFVHPNIFDWPKKDSTLAETKLPFFNWKADEVREIVKLFDPIWSNIYGHYKDKLFIRTGIKVTEINEQNDLRYSFSAIKFNKSLPTRKKERSDERAAYDIVLYAGGFGLETHNLKQFNSYWHKDKWDSDVDYGSYKFRIEGTGDGGLIDTVRLSLRDFDYEEFIKGFPADTLFHELGIEMQKADTDIQKNNSLSKDQISLELQKRYDTLFTPKYNKIIKYLLEKYPIRQNTTVTLVGLTSTPYTLQSSLLNRMILYLLLQTGAIHYRQVKQQAEHKYRIVNWFRKKKKQISNFFSSEIIIERLGPERPFKKILNIPKDCIPDQKSERIRLGAEKYWPADYFDACPFIKKI